MKSEFVLVKTTKGIFLASKDPVKTGDTFLNVLDPATRPTKIESAKDADALNTCVEMGILKVVKALAMEGSATNEPELPLLEVIDLTKAPKGRPSQD